MLRHRLRDWLGLWPTDPAGVRGMVARQWRGIARRTPTYLAGYADGAAEDRRGQRRAEWLAHQLARSGAATVIELGCGPGRNLAAVHRQAPWIRLIGVDICPEAVRAAWEVLPTGQIVEGDLHSFDIAQLVAARERRDKDSEPERVQPRQERVGQRGRGLSEGPARPILILTVGCLGHLEPSAVPRLLRQCLDIADRLILIEQPGDGEVLKGPRAWGPQLRATGEYVLWAHPLIRWLLEAGLSEVRAVPLPDEFRAPGATEMLQCGSFS